MAAATAHCRKLPDQQLQKQQMSQLVTMLPQQQLMVPQQQQLMVPQQQQQLMLNSRLVGSVWAIGPSVGMGSSLNGGSRCNFCKEVISGDQFIRTDLMACHIECFRCCTCCVVMLGMRVFRIGNRICCQRCFRVLTICAHCGSPIINGKSWVELNGRAFHPHHLFCSAPSCGTVLRFEPGLVLDEKKQPLCPAHHPQAAFCAVCGSQLIGEAIQLTDRCQTTLRHPECFMCSLCGCLLGWQYIIDQFGRPMCSGHIDMSRAFERIPQAPPEEPSLSPIREERRFRRPRRPRRETPAQQRRRKREERRRRHRRRQMRRRRRRRRRRQRLKAESEEKRKLFQLLYRLDGMNYADGSWNMLSRANANTCNCLPDWNTCTSDSGGGSGSLFSQELAAASNADGWMLQTDASDDQLSGIESGERSNSRRSRRDSACKAFETGSSGSGTGTGESSRGSSGSSKGSSGSSKCSSGCSFIGAESGRESRRRSNSWHTDSETPVRANQ